MIDSKFFTLSKIARPEVCRSPRTNRSHDRAYGRSSRRGSSQRGSSQRGSSQRGSSQRGSSRRGCKRTGVAIVEFAMIVPMLLLLTMGMIQGGIILNAHLSLSNTVRDVGRYAAINGTKVGCDADIKNYAVAKARGFSLDVKPEDVTIGPAPENTTNAPNNRTQYTTELVIVMKSDISGRVFLPPNFMGAKMLPGGILSTSTTVICE